MKTQYFNTYLKKHNLKIWVKISSKTTLLKRKDIELADKMRNNKKL